MECFKPLRCNIEDKPGNPGEARPFVETASELAAPVLRLSKLGFLRPASGGGLINEGDDGSDAPEFSGLVLRLSARLFRFLNLRGPGDVMGLPSFRGKRIKGVSVIFKLWKESRPNEEPGNEDKGTNVTGDSGEELGDGSDDNEEESTVDIVVVGDESVESEACVDVLSRC